MACICLTILNEHVIGLPQRLFDDDDDGDEYALVNYTEVYWLQQFKDGDQEQVLKS